MILTHLLKTDTMTRQYLDEGDLDHLKAECQTCGRTERIMCNHDNKTEIAKKLRREFGSHIDDGTDCYDFKIYQVWAGGEEAEI